MSMLNGTTEDGISRANLDTMRMTGSPMVTATSNGANATALATSALSSTGISSTMARNRLGAIEATSSVMLAPRDVPPTTASSILRWSRRATTSRANWVIEYRHMSRGRADSPWPSGSSRITR